MIHPVYLRSHLRADVPTTETSTSGGKFHANLNEGIPQKKAPCIPERASGFCPSARPRVYLSASLREKFLSISRFRKNIVTASSGPSGLRLGSNSGPPRVLFPTLLHALQVNRLVLRNKNRRDRLTNVHRDTATAREKIQRVKTSPLKNPVIIFWSDK